TPPPSSAGVDFGSAAAIQSDLVVLRRRLHGTPELGNDLRQTQAAVLRAREGLPPEGTTGRALGSVGAVLRGSLPEGAQRPTVLLRGDMHTAGLVGAARLVSAHVEEIPGDVILMVQPGEEGPGARSR